MFVPDVTTRSFTLSPLSTDMLFPYVSPNVTSWVRIFGASPSPSVRYTANPSLLFGLRITAVSGTTITYNRAEGGEGDKGGGGGQGIGGGVYNLGTFSFDATTVIAHNHASTSNDDTLGV